MNEDQKLSLLKDILLTDEKEFATRIAAKIVALEETLAHPEKLRTKVDPIIQEELRDFTQRIPEQLGPVITETLKVQIAESRDEVVEALYPIMGQMIKKYIAQEIKILSENIEQKTKNTFSISTIKRKVKSVFTGVSSQDIILSELAQAKIDQVFIIDNQSGILLGSYGEKNAVDEDMVSGMLTAIKGFVEDAFEEKSQKLKSIEYELYQVHLYNSHTYYIATAVNGTLTEKLESEIEDLAIQISNLINKKNIKNDKEKIEQLLDSIYANNNLNE
jgi:hypothetical protein